MFWWLGKNHALIRWIRQCWAKTPGGAVHRALSPELDRTWSFVSVQDSLNPWVPRFPTPSPMELSENKPFIKNPTQIYLRACTTHCTTVDWVSKENTRKPTKQFLIKKLSQSEQGSSSSKEFTQLFLPLLSVSRSSLPYLLTCFSLRQASREIKQNWELRQTLIYQKAPRKLALKELAGDGS